MTAYDETIYWLQQLIQRSDAELFVAVAAEADPNRKTLILTEIRFRGCWVAFRQWRDAQPDTPAAAVNGAG